MTFDFRLSRLGGAAVSLAPLGLSVQLLNSDDTLSAPVSIRDHVDLPSYGGHVVLDTVRIPLSAFTSVNLTAVRGARFVFDDTAAGAVALTGLRFSRSTLATTPAPSTPPTHVEPSPVPERARGTVRVTHGNRLTGARAQPSNEVEVALESDVAFHVTDDLARLRIGDHDVVLSNYDTDGDTHRIVFRIAPDELDTLTDGAPMQVRYGRESASFEWDFGTFEKAAIQR